MVQNILNNQNNLKALRVAEYLDSQQQDVQEKALQQAIELGDEDEAAKIVRIIRNKLLLESDAEVSLDRLNFDVSSTANFLKSLEDVLTGEWATYRQALRDIPEQEGFPFNTVFPESPRETSNTTEKDINI